jgi:hypothetical protein
MLHVTNGDCAATLIRAALPGAEVLPWRDMLHDGPVPAGLDLQRLSQARADFIASELGLDRAEVRHSFGRRDGQLLAALQAGAPVTLWFEHDLYDQLQLLQILSLLPGTRSTVMLVQADDYLGVQTPERLRELQPTKRPVTASQIEVASRCWAAFRAPTPEALANRLRTDLMPLPFLRDAIARLLEELPHPKDGLSRTERWALERLRRGPASRPELFAHVSAAEPARWLGDLPLFRRLDRLRPLVDGEADRLALTAIGQDVLAGDRDRVEVAAPDFWLGGTRIRPGTIWRWDAVARELSLD